MSLVGVERRPEILPLTGIRAFAAWWVVMFHIAYLLPLLPAVLYWFARLGFLGVDLFFVLSGFIISYNYQQRFWVFSRDTYKTFLWARLARLYPVHLFTLILSALLLLGVRISRVATVKDFSTWTPGNFLANVVLAQAWRPYFIESWNNASWSVSCEWFAYLVFPLLVLGGRKKLPLPVVALCAVMLPAIPAVFVQIAYIPPFFLIIKVLSEFAAGCLMFHIYIGWREGMRFKKGILCAFSFALGLALILLWELRHIAPDWLALIFPFVILSVAKSSGVFERLLGSRIAVYWGRVSYSLYMTHNVTLWILKAVLPVRRDGAGVMVFSIYIVSISIVAIVTYHFVEEPCRTWMRTQGRRKSPCIARAGKDEEDAVPRAISN